MIVLLLLAFAGCEAATTTDVPETSRLSSSVSDATIRIISGNGEIVSPGQVVKNVEVELADGSGKAINKVFVYWEVTDGGGSTQHPVTRTNGRGRTSVHWTTGTEVGAQTLAASALGVGSVTFTATVVGDEEPEETDGGSAPGEGESEGGDPDDAESHDDDSGDESTDGSDAGEADDADSDAGGSDGDDSDASDEEADDAGSGDDSDDSAGEGDEEEPEDSGDGGHDGAGEEDSDGEEPGDAEDEEPGDAEDEGPDGPDGDDPDEGDSAGEAPGTLAVTPGNIIISAIGDEAHLQVQAKDADGKVIVNPDVTWSSSDHSVVTVNEEGKVLALAAGTALVIASSPCCTADTVSIAVEQTVRSVEVSPTHARLSRGETTRLEAEARDSNGHPVAGAAFTWSSDDGTVATVDDLGSITAGAEGTARITAATTEASAHASIEVAADEEPDAGTEGIWIGRDELARLPTSGTAWNNVKKAADTNLRGGVLTDRDDHNARVMAAALVAARLDDDGYRARVRDALVDVMDARLVTEDGLAVNRRLGSYAIAADLIELSSFDSVVDGLFRGWLELIRNTTFQSGGGGTPAGYHERRPNNYGTHAGASRMAVALYLGDRADFERAVLVLKGYLGDRAAYSGFQYRVDWSWHADENRPVGINPKGAMKDGRNIDGAIPDDQRRCGTFYEQPWPCTTGYTWEALQGVVAMAWIAHRQGYPAFEWEDQAIRRANVWLYEVNDHPAAGDDTWQPHIINHIYGTTFPAPIPSRHGKNVGWTDWTHSPG